MKLRVQINGISLFWRAGVTSCFFNAWFLRASNFKKTEEFRSGLTRYKVKSQQPTQDKTVQSILGTFWWFGCNSVTSPASFKQMPSFPAGFKRQPQGARCKIFCSIQISVLEIICTIVCSRCYFMSKSNIGFCLLCDRQSGQRDRQHNLDSCYSGSWSRQLGFLHPLETVEKSAICAWKRKPLSDTSIYASGAYF